METKTMTVEEHIEALKAFLLSCFHRGDWHGVSDAANDIRCIEAGASKITCGPHLNETLDSARATGVSSQSG